MSLRLPLDQDDQDIVESRRQMHGAPFRLLLRLCVTKQAAAALLVLALETVQRSDTHPTDHASDLLYLSRAAPHQPNGI